MDSKCCTAMILHYTFGWSYQCAHSFLRMLPDEPLLVFNNNPFVGQKVEMTRRHKPAYWNSLCQQEKKGIVRLGLPVIEIPRDESDVRSLPTHGSCLDFMFQWCADQGYEKIVLIEPDCRVFSKKWHRFLKEGLEDAWVAGFRMGQNIPVHVCPTAWDIEATLRFKNQHDFSFNGYHQYNTGQRFISKFNKLGKLKIIERKKMRGFWHVERGTIKNHKWIASL